jgi:protein phosphatase
MKARAESVRSSKPVSPPASAPISPSTSPVPPNPDATGDEIVVHVFGRTDVGRTREHNEDSFVIVDLTTNDSSLPEKTREQPAGPKGSMFMVADGMGGAAAGEIASAMAVEVILGEMRSSWVASPATDREAFVHALKAATQSANGQIHNYASHHAEYRGMGTTATIAGLLGDTLYIAQVGDSRAYIVRDGVAQQITKDQSLMQRLVEAGELTEEEAEHSERRNIILQALGPEQTIRVDLTHQTVRRGDSLVLCSDGLSSQVPRDLIGEVVGSQPDLALACKELIDLANARGGPDNITVIIARFDGPGLSLPSEDDEVGHRVFPFRTGLTPTDRLDILDIDPRVFPTEEMPAVDMPDDAETADEAGDLEPPRPPSPSPGDRMKYTPKQPVTPVATPVVSDARRSAGRSISIALMVLLIAGALWFLWHSLTREGGPLGPSATTSAPR